MHGKRDDRNHDHAHVNDCDADVKDCDSDKR